MDGQQAHHAHLPGAILRTALDVWGQVGGHHWIPITGRSMLPLIRPDDRVLVVHGDAGVRRGDVVVFRRRGRLIVHRVLHIEGGGCGTVVMTKGDNTRHCDAPWSAEEMVGRVRAIKRDGRLIPLDSAGWRMIGRLIAIVTVVWIRVDRSGHTVKRRLLGPRPSRIRVVLRRSALACSTLALRGVDVLFCRGKP